MAGHPARVMAVLLVLAAGRAAGADPLDVTEVSIHQGATLAGVAAEYLTDPSGVETLRAHNPDLPGDPDSPLAARRLKIPTAALKRQFRAGMLVYAAGEVLSRVRETSDWRRARSGILLHDGDGLRTLEDSRARVRFAGKAMLELEPNSLAILKRPRHTAYDLSLEGGRFLVNEVSAFSRGVGFVPRMKDTSYSVTRVQDRETEVRVHHGEIGVRDAANKEMAVVGAGYLIRIPDGQRPSVPERFSLSPRTPGPAPVVQIPSEADAPIAKPVLGVPVAAYRIQVARDRGFQDIVLEKRFEAGSKVKFEELGLPPGEYWMRVASIDLLGDQGPFSAPKLRRIAPGRGGAPA